jgi:glycosyltransferase involved in cell wall biosynthesis
VPGGGPARVLWLIKGLGPGGAERLVADIVPRLDRDRFIPEVVYLLPWKDHLAGPLRDAGVPVRCLEVRSHLDLGWPRRLRRLLQGVDLLHAHLPFAAVGGRWAARGFPPAARPAVVYTEHNLWARYRGLTALANARTFGWNDRVIAVSQAVRDSIAEGARRTPPVTVIENGVDAEGLRAAALAPAEARAELGLPAGAFVIGTVGGITPKKGHLHLVRAARTVVDAHPEAVFAVVGLGAVEAPVRTEIARLGLQDSVRLLGVREQASRLMRAFDVFCLPSRFEGLPVALLEALATGVPAVATEVGGVPAVLAAGGGLLVPPADEPALAAALGSLIADRGRLADLASEAPSVAARYSLERTVRETEALYEDVLAERRTRR